MVNIKIYNVVGQQVASLTEKSYAAGYHTIPFNGSHLSTGVYIVRVAIEPAKGLNQILSEKITLIK